MSKDIVSGIAITVAIFAVSLFLPVVGFFSAVFIPLPIAVYRVKLGRQPGLVVAAAAMGIILAVLGSATVDALAFFELLLLGFVLGELFERRFSVERVMLLACSAVILTIAGSLMVASVISSASIGEMVSAYVARNLELTLAMYENMGISEDAIQTLEGAMDKIQYSLVRILPGLMTVSVLFVCWSNILMACFVLERRGLRKPEFGPLGRWKAPEGLVWGVIVCGALVVISPTPMKLLGINGLLIFCTIYFFQGIAIVSYYFEKKKFPRILRIMIYCFIAVQQLALLAVIGLGLFDIWLNFRKLDGNGDPGASES